MTAYGDASRINAKTLGILGCPDEGERCLRIFQILRESEIARTAPRASIVYGDDSPTCATDSLCEVQVLLVARKAMKENERRMWWCP
jgi:hypothetical protein